MKIYIPVYTLLLFVGFINSSNGQSIIDHLNDNSRQNETVMFNTSYTIDEIKTISTPNAPSRMTRKIRNDKDGNLIFASYSDIIRYDGTTFTKLKLAEGYDSFDAFDVWEDNKGGTWIASTHFGVFHYPLSSKLETGNKPFNHFTPENGLAHIRTMCLYEDKSGGIWICTEGGISYYDRNSSQNGQISFRNFTQKHGLTNSSVNTIMEDKSGKIWAGTRGTVSVYDPLANLLPSEVPFKEVKNKEGKGFENIWSIIEDRNGYIWLGGQYGLWRFDGRSFIHLSTVSVVSVYEDKKGTIWFTHGADATHTVGLSYYEQKSLLESNPVATQAFFGGKMLWGITEDNEGNIWFGKLDGALRYNGETVDHFKDEENNK